MPSFSDPRESVKRAAWACSDQRALAKLARKPNKSVTGSATMSTAKERGDLAAPNPTRFLMPTHRGKTQTDIIIDGGGDYAGQHTEFEFDAVYSTAATLDYADLAPGTDRQSVGYELILRNTANVVLATF